MADQEYQKRTIAENEDIKKLNFIQFLYLVGLFWTENVAFHSFSTPRMKNFLEQCYIVGAIFYGICSF